MTPANNEPREAIRIITRVAGWPTVSRPPAKRARPDARTLFLIHAAPRVAPRSIQERSQRLVLSAHAERIPAVFTLSGELGKVSLGVGTCVFDGEKPVPSLARRATVLERLVRFAYPGADVAQISSPVQLRPDWTGLWVGVPSHGHVHRVARALSGLRFVVLIIAEPLELRTVTDLIDAAGAEQRSHLAKVADSRLAEPAVSLLKSHLEQFTERMRVAAAVGGWRTAVYMMADTDGAAACRAIYRAAYGSATPGKEQMTWWDGAEAANWAVQWGMPDAEPVHPLVPYPWQSVLSSDELANLMCLPAEELPGFRLLDQPSFDVVPPFVAPDTEKKPSAAVAIVLGRVVSDGRPTELDYAIRTEQLTKHCFIAGTTGSGKTNTVFQVLRQVALQKIPFLVIEPTKREYRALVREPEFARMRVYTLGDELGLPLRLNPLVPEPGTPISVHIDLLKGVIGASIGAWNPLPQILEKALHRVFVESGWDIVRNTNYRVRGSAVPLSAYPTLEDLLEMSVAVTRELGYSERVGPDIEAALRVRLESLMTGGKGKMLATREQQSIEDLLARPTVLELESIVDEDECAFVMGVLLIKIVEHLRRLGNTSACRLVVVVEEAHRLLGAAHRASPEIEGSARFKAVSMFSNLLAEVRAYGASLIICDQSPSKLSGDVLKNTNTKLAHRIVSADDVGALATAMRIREEQTGALASLSPGTAAVFSGGDDYPVLMTVPLVKKDAAWPTNDELRAVEPKSPQSLGRDVVWMDRLASVHEWSEAVDRLLNVVVGTPQAAIDAWKEVRAVALRHLPAALATTEVIKVMAANALARALRVRGRVYAWPYDELDSVTGALDGVLDAMAEGKSVSRQKADTTFRPLAERLHALPTGPLASCKLSCARDTGVECVYRVSAARLSDSQEWRDVWRQAQTEPNEQAGKALVALTREASEIMIGPYRSADTETQFRRAAFCFAQHMIRREMRERPESAVAAANEYMWQQLA